MRCERKCKKKDCYKRTNGYNSYCSKHAVELEIAAVRILTGQNRKQEHDQNNIL